jgi:N-methylhydantoinase A/oxoprolinase/acetone carboxylase beta subunit
MQSNGGMISINEARKNGVRCILSGPAGGVIGAEFISKEKDSTGKKNSQARLTKLS